VLSGTPFLFLANLRQLASIYARGEIFLNLLRLPLGIWRKLRYFMACTAEDNKPASNSV
jgi:hypothetical protein